MDIDLNSITNDFKDEEPKNNLSNKPKKDPQPPREVKQVIKKNIQKVDKEELQEPPKEELQDNKNKKMELVTILRLYMMKFKDDLKDYSKMKFDKLNMDELNELRSTFDIILGANTSINNRVRMFYNALYFVEKTVTTFNLLDLTGLTQILYSNQDFQKDLQRLSLKYLSANDSKPEISVLMTLIQSCFELDRVNSQKNLKGIENKDIDKIDKVNKLNNEYNDL